LKQEFTMRHLLAVGLVVVLGNQAPANRQPPQGDIWVTIAPSQVAGGSASVRVMRSEIYVDDQSSAGVGVGVPLPGAKAPELMFSVRAWKEGDKARVVVCARLEDKRAPDGKTETPVATFAITPGQSVEVRESEKWGAPRYVVSAAFR
jgi:hypothetical protein